MGTVTPRARVTSLLAFLAGGIVLGYALRRPPPPAEPLPTKPEPAPVEEAAQCGPTYESELLDCRAALTASKTRAMRQAAEPPAASSESRPEAKTKIAGVQAATDDVATAPAAADGKRHMPYQPYRDYRAYRLYKAYKSPKQSQTGTAEDCKNTPLARECIGTEEFCKRLPDDDKCVGTEIYCAKYPNEESCLGTKHACARNHRRNGCEGTEFFCKDAARTNSPDCRGTEVYCGSGKKNDPYCQGTAAHCGVYPEVRICEPDES